MAEFDRAAAEQAALLYELDYADPDKVMSRHLRAAIAETDRLKVEVDELDCTCDDEQAAHQETLLLWKQAVADRDRLAAEVAALKSTVALTLEPPELMAAATDAQRRADEYAERLCAATEENRRLAAENVRLRAALEQYARPDYYYFLLDPLGQRTDPTKKAREALAESL